MRTGKFAVVLAIITVAVFASSADAQQQFSLSTSPTITGGNVTFRGTVVNLQQTTSINCDVSAILNVVGGVGSNNASLSLPSISAGGSPFCGFVVSPITPWSAQTILGQTIASSGTAWVTVTVGANTIAGDPCNPQPVQAVLSTSGVGPSTLTFNDVVLQAASGRWDRRCRINGVLTATPATSVTTRVFIH